MMSFLFSAQGRVNRGKFWSVLLYYLAASIAVGVVVVALWQVIPGEVKPDGSYGVSGVKAIPYLVLIFGFILFCAWSGICLGIKRYHDRDKSGWWILIQFVPFIGAIWYFVEAGCLRGTVGINRFGPDPLGGVAPV